MAVSQPDFSQPNLGMLAEALVAQWLVQQNWQILEQRWRCRWGELDLVALHSASSSLAFVEVKARRRGNWDADGLLAITSAKREKLRLAAELFLSAYPELAALPCRFDVALVFCQLNSQAASRSEPGIGETIMLQQPVWLGSYCLTLHHYLPAAFD
jgi:putative endonuclease